MRFSLIDLLIAIAFMTTAIGLTKPLVPVGNPRISFTIEITTGTFLYLLGSSWLYRRFHLFPLLLPRCPVCRDKHRDFVTLSRSWPTETIQCAMCQAQIELRLDGTRGPNPASNMPRFELLWPYSFGGRWRRLEPGVAPE